MAYERDEAPEKIPPSLETSDDDDYYDDDDYDLESIEESHQLQSFPRRFSGEQPLINYVSNNWQNQNSQSRSVSTPSSSWSSSFDWHRAPWLAFLMSIFLAPKVRRYLMVSAILITVFFIGWEGFLLQASMGEPQIIYEPLENVKEAIDRAGKWTVTNARPEFDDFVAMKSMDVALLPNYERNRWESSQRRLVFVGDVHGCQNELEELLDKIAFDHTAGDHLIFTGDMIAKGPYSGGVVDIARNLSASCVRGDYEDRILLERSDLKDRNILEIQTESFNKFDLPVYKDDERDVARSLTDDQAAWLQECPAILRVGQIKGMGEVVVAHGGLVPGIPLEAQELSSVMTMRNIDENSRIPTSKPRKGTPWYKLYNEYNTLIASGKLPSKPADSYLSTVIYGHDAEETYNIRQYTKGLDSGCIYGWKLSALIIEDGGESKIVQVKCNEMCKPS